MATTRIIPMHNNKGKTISQSLKARIDYVKNPEKTNGGELITAYACSPETADAEFLLARNEYLATTGRTHRNEVIAYQLRQSFKPGEVTPEEANQIGYELASQFLRGDHAFIVATHNDRRHIHNHIVFCATTLDCTHKFRNVYRSDRLLAKLSDQICAEHNLSVINEPNSQSKPYDQELMTKGEISSRNILRMSIDAALRMQPEGFDALIQLLEDAGCWIKRGAQISIKPPGGKRYIRLDTLGAEYSEEALRMTLAGKHVHIPKQARGKMPHAQIELLINIEAKMRAGKGKGYERWAERHNTDVMASSMLYLIDNHISSYAELEHNIQSAVDRRTELKSTISTAQARMQEISKQKKAILVYTRTKDVYTQYRESGWSSAFYREHKADIEAHKEAQAVYSAAGGKLPTISELSAEYALLLSQKKQAGEQLSHLNDELKNLRHIKSNMDTLLDDERFEEEQTRRMRDTELEHVQNITGKNR